MPNLRRLLAVAVAVLSCAFLTGCESFESNCEEVLGGSYSSDSSSEYKWVLNPSNGKMEWKFVTTTVDTCVKDNKVVDQDVNVSVL